ncbi:hypothetical protein D1007_57476 [Hordeum vulgare]|nr:hypothetical protein D1007_57476 [Hordeum vulgare]
MADARRAHAQHRATRIAQTVPVGPAGERRSRSRVVNAATGPKIQEREGSSHLATEHPDGRTATPSLARPSGTASHAWPEVPHRWRALAMATEDSTMLSCVIRPQPSQANDKEQDVPPPPSRHDVRTEPRKEARPRNRPCEPKQRPGDKVCC